MYESISGTVAETAREWGAWLRASGKSLATCRVYEWRLKSFVDCVGASAAASTITVGVVDAWVAGLFATNLRRNSIASASVIVRSYCRFLYRRGYLMMDLSQQTDPVRREKRQRHPVPLEDVRRLYAACDSDRDRLLILLLYGCGLRSSEAWGLKWQDVDLERGTALIHGKGSKQRMVGLGKAALEVLAGMEQKASIPILGLGSNQAVEYRLTRLCRLAELRRYTPHQLRHSFAHSMLPLEDVVTLSRQMGHEDVSTTALYLREAGYLEAVERMKDSNPGDLLAG